MFNLVEVLKRTYGYGARPDIRQRLYVQLQKEVDQHGERAYRIIRECMEAAASRRSPDRWFCAAVVPRLREKLGVPSTVDEAVAAVFKGIGAQPLS